MLSNIIVVNRRVSRTNEEMRVKYRDFIFGRKKEVYSKIKIGT